jgi:hypothetical protein
MHDPLVILSCVDGTDMRKCCILQSECVLYAELAWQIKMVLLALRGLLLQGWRILYCTYLGGV